MMSYTYSVESFAPSPDKCKESRVNSASTYSTLLYVPASCRENYLIHLEESAWPSTAMHCGFVDAKGSDECRAASKFISFIALACFCLEISTAEYAMPHVAMTMVFCVQ